MSDLCLTHVCPTKSAWLTPGLIELNNPHGEMVKSHKDMETWYDLSKYEFLCLIFTQKKHP